MTRRSIVVKHISPKDIAQIFNLLSRRIYSAGRELNRK